MIATGIQKGESIQNQDQDIKSHNFRTINTTPSIYGIAMIDSAIFTLLIIKKNREED
jgi:hypothetical protein